MQMYQGATASPGLVMGPVRRLQHSGPGLERVVQTPGREQALLNAAVVLAKDELRLIELFGLAQLARFLGFEFLSVLLLVLVLLEAVARHFEVEDCLVDLVLVDFTELTLLFLGDVCARASAAHL